MKFEFPPTPPLSDKHHGISKSIPILTWPRLHLSIPDKEETHYVPLVVFCEALHLHQESIQWQTMQTAPRNMTDSWPTKSRKQWPKYTHHTSSAEDSRLFLVPSFLDKLRDWYTKFTRCGTLFWSALRARWRQNEMETAASSAFLFLAHKAKHTKTNRISRLGLHNCGFRQLPPHMLALVAQLLSNATIKPLQLQQSELVSHVVTTLLKSTCLNRFMFP